MIAKFCSAVNVGGIYNKIKSDVCGGFPTAVFGVNQSEKCRIASSLETPVLYIVRDGITAKNVARLISQYLGEEAVFLPAKDDTLLYKSTFDKERLYSRLQALYKISTGAKVTVTTFEALLQLFPKKISYITLNKGGEYDLVELPKTLVSLGYKRVEVCETAGTFSVRGDILYVFPVNDQAVYRLDFFGDELESVRRAGEEVDSVTAIITTDCVILPSEVPAIKEKIKNAYKSYGTLLVGERAKNLYSKLTDKLETDLFDDSLGYVLPLLSSVTHDFTRYFKDNTVVVYDEGKAIYENLTYHVKEHNDRVDGILRTGDGLEFIRRQLSSEEEVLKLLEKFNKLAVQTLTSKIELFNPLKTHSVKTTPVPRYFLRLEDLIADLKAWQFANYTVVLCAKDLKSANSLYYKAVEHGVKITVTEVLDGNERGLYAVPYELDYGFISHDDKLAVIGTLDLFAKNSREKAVKRKRGDLFYAPTVGEFAVHEHFGVGLVKGVKRIATIEGAKDYVELEYAGGDRLYVSTDNMDKLSKYLGGNETPSLSKIGGGEFERIKERVKASIAKMTINLKKLYAERKAVKGYAFSPEDALSKEFESAFGFEETEDQISSVEEIVADMESSIVMDRLLCGDVGFGKTEVAFRAAFKAVKDGKQVALVAPTTILTQQHYNTAISRFEGFGVRIAVLNRFKTKKQQEKIIEDAKSGGVDILIGTHRLFSKDVKFKDLGLLIIDEEQRFGVEHKEKLKLLKSNVDTLSLSATPIPRTLHLSLSGIRDISTINTPPKQRIPVQTVVTELTDGLIKDALSRELSRGGQAFILFNRVEEIYKFADRVSKIVPSARIIVAHGQMPERQLENSISAFYQGEYDVLIATTIIENGIDMPRANTLIVESADRLGLSTLYQLKGRVGRGNLMAYAYFTYEEGKVLTEPSYKRFSALMEYTEMGSGYKIAMRDLEIRGAGNVLGKEQHGHLDKVGYELYSKLLKQELGEVTLNQELELDVKADAYIPENYIVSEKLRMDAYKLIAEIHTEGDALRIKNSLIENYGHLPKAVETLILIALVKSKASNVEGVKFVVSLGVCRLTLKNLESLKDGRITSKLKKYSNKVTLTFDERPVLVFNVLGGKPEDLLALVAEFLTFE